MITVFLRGGLGNQLFQYSAGVFLSRKLGTSALFRTDLLPAKADSIGVVSRWPNQLSEFRSEGLVEHRKHQPSGSTHLTSKLLQAIRVLGNRAPNLLMAFGVIAGERYSKQVFTSVRRVRIIDSYCFSSVPALHLGDVLRSQVRDIKEPSARYLELSKEAIRDRPMVVHVRLGDYQNLKHLYGEPKYEGMLKVVNDDKGSRKVPVWVFTDSPDLIPEQIREKFGAAKVIGPRELKRPIENLVLMSMGSSLICSNSTFSWWAAFLLGENGSVFYPRPDGLPHEIFSKDMVVDKWTAY